MEKTTHRVSSDVLITSVYTRTQSSTYRANTGATAPKSSFAALRQLYQTGGITSLWRGAVPTALRDAPGAGLFIVFYERGRRLLGVRGDSGGGALGGGMAGVSAVIIHGPRQRLRMSDVSTSAGASASLLSTLMTTPFDLIKTRRQISPATYPTLLTSISLIYRTSGIRGFWEGGGLRVVRKAGSAGIGWAVYEAVVGIGERRTSSYTKRLMSRSGGG